MLRVGIIIKFNQETGCDNQNPFKRPFTRAIFSLFSSEFEQNKLMIFFSENQIFMAISNCLVDIVVLQHSVFT